jgi:exonuclease SbcD
LKILHTSDWHLGKKLEDFPRISEQKQVMKEICDIAEREDADAVLIAGDLFDTPNPSSEAIELFYKTLKELSNDGKRAVIAIAGNHDSAERIEAPDPLARECGIILSGYPKHEFGAYDIGRIKVLRGGSGFLELKLEGWDYPLRIIATAYANEYRLKAYLGQEDTEKQLRDMLEAFWKDICDTNFDDKGVNVLLTHLYVVDEQKEYPDEPDEEKSILHVGAAQPVFIKNLPLNLNYAALGHLHRANIISDAEYPVAYSGSPLCYSLSESMQEKYVLIAECEPKSKTKVSKIKLESGRKVCRKKFDNYVACKKWLSENPDAICEITLSVDDFITTEMRREMYKLSGGIVRIIPELKGGEVEDISLDRSDLSKGIKELFCDYYRSKYTTGAPPDILSLFDEVLNLEDEN